MEALILLLIAVIAAPILLVIVRHSRDEADKMQKEKEPGIKITVNHPKVPRLICPRCGSPVMLRGNGWECGWCLDSGGLDSLSRTRPRTELRARIVCGVDFPLTWTDLKDELEKQQTVLVKIEALKNESRDLEEELKQVRKTLLSFEEYAKDATPEVLTSLIHSVVEKIYVTTENNERVCHIFIKGCADEDYSDLFKSAGNTGGKPLSENCTNTCDKEGDCKRYPYLCGNPAQT